MPTQPSKDKEGAATTAAPSEPPKPRFQWEATSSDSRQAHQGAWRVRVQRLGGTGLWRPFVEYVGADYTTEAAAEKALERLLR